MIGTRFDEKLVWVWLIAASCLFVPEPAGAEEVPFDDPRWQISADSAEIVDFEEKQALRLEGGRAWLPDVEITDGVIEFDIAFTPERGFSGAMFRVKQPGDFENFYFRPHQSGQPDASQYTPEVQGVSGWQLYHGLEFSPPFTYRFNEWMHVVITFAGSQATVSLDGETHRIPRLKRPVTAGAVGVRSGFAPAYFAEFSYRDGVPEDFPTAAPPQVDREPVPEGLVRRWRVSQAFPADQRPAIELEHSFREDLSWKVLEVEEKGFVNLAWAEGVSGDHRAVLAETSVEASGAGHCLLRFGYSDVVRVFFDGVEIYRGNNLYRSRDYRYLGTIGLFDAIVVPVTKGEHVVSFVVAENFGGWGVMAAIESAGSTTTCGPAD